jgi:hypothetical protein
MPPKYSYDRQAYIMKGYFSMPSPPAKLAKAALTNEAIYGDSAYLIPPLFVDMSAAGI